MARKRIGLALGGGVARGMAHLGVLSVLEEACIPVDYVAGTSAGSLIGSLFCAGLATDRIVETGLNLRWWRLARLVWPIRGFVSFDPLRDWLATLLGDPQFSDLKIPFAAVAADLDTGEPVVLSEGRLAPAVQASCSVPGIVTPVMLDGRMLGDGSLVSTVPVSTLRSMGAEYVIGVDIFAAKIRPRWGPLGMGINAIEILIRRSGGGIDDADCLIAPDLAGRSYIRFSKRLEYFELGRAAAIAALERIREGAGLEATAPVR